MLPIGMEFLVWSKEVLLWVGIVLVEHNIVLAGSNWN